MTLKTQPTAMPTRKLAAVIIAAFVEQGALGVAERLAPGLSAVLPAQDYIAMLVPLFAGYLVKDRA